MKLRLSASRLGLARLCLYWAGPDVKWPDDDGSDAADIGTWYHAVGAWVIGGKIGAEPEPPACMGDACEFTPVDDALAFLAEHPDAKIATEVAYVYSRDGKARHIGFNVNRNYGPLEPGEIPGSADVVALYPHRAVVVDWKTGQRVDSARDNLQLALLAVCVAQYHGVDEVEVQLRYADGWIDRHTYDAFGLLDAKDELDAILSSEDLTPHAGLHCTSRYCPLRTTCPETTKVVAELVEESEGVGAPLMSIAGDSRGIMNPQHAGYLWHRAAAAQALLDSVVKAVKEYVDNHGAIPLGDGKELACIEETRESIDASTIQAIYDPIQHLLTAEQFAECVSVSVPKGALEKAIKSGAERGKKEAVWDAAVSALREAGRVRAKTITRHSVRKAKAS